MTFPVHDWQFWVVTVAALLGAWRVLRTLLAVARTPKGETPACPGCDSCGAASSAPARGEGLVQLGAGRSGTRADS